MTNSVCGPGSPLFEEGLGPCALRVLHDIDIGGDISRRRRTITRKGPGQQQMPIEGVGGCCPQRGSGGSGIAGVGQDPAPVSREVRWASSSWAPGVSGGAL